MNKDLWSLYLSLQNEIPYEHSLSEPGDKQTPAIADYLARLKGVTPYNEVLFVGPGHPLEITYLSKALEGASSIHALSAHLPEVEAINASKTAFATLGDMHDMPYETGWFDLVFAANVLEHAFAPYIALLECRRVLKHGGIAYFVMPTFEGKEGGRGEFHLHCLDNNVWCELLRKTGFVITDRIFYKGDTEGGYHHFVCAASSPPHPHNILASRIISHKAAK